MQNFISKSLERVAIFLPNFFAGGLILIAGVLLSEIARRLFILFVKFLKIKYLLIKKRLMNESELEIWQTALAELIRWEIILFFLIPTVEAWGLSRITSVFNRMLVYLSNIFLSVVVIIIGIILINFLTNRIKKRAKSFNKKTLNILLSAIKVVIIFLVSIIVLDQLGVAQDFIKILFTGIVAMFSLAGGIAFGLGGKDVAKKIITKIYKRLK